jgi:2-oxoglutarate ferredoxin oxidoreductase subunit beta
MHDGSHMRLRKLHENYDPTDKTRAVQMLMDVHEKGEVLTGVFYVNTQKPDFSTLLNMVDEPLATLPESRTRPSRAVLAELMEAHL